EGIYYWFEHAGEPGGADFGTHRLVLADHSHDTAELGVVRFHRRDESERSDSVQQWSIAKRWRPGKVERATWDYRTLERRQASAEADVGRGNHLGIVDRDTCGPYGWQDNA
ncbi:MAG TPA: type VI secretion system tip protein VgrG, partial [Stenotrophomonas sp.]|nr:type VI secretion system tip protein VgrG [Stenotrophomonas sp.]